MITYYYDEIPDIGFKAIEDVDYLQGYEFGEDGTIISFRKTGQGSPLLRAEPKKLKPYLNRDGYLEINLGGKRHLRVNRLIAMAWIPKEDGKPFVLHNDGQKLENHYTNLRWGTVQENREDSIKHGTYFKPRKFGDCKLTPAQVLEIRENAGNETVTVMARRFDVARATIIAARDGRSWQWV